MTELFETSVFFGVVISLIGYEIGLFLKRKLKKALFNPLLVAILFVMAFLKIFHVDYQNGLPCDSAVSAVRAIKKP